MAGKDKIDIVNMVLEDCILAFPTSSFIISLYQQYQKRGSLSKKQLEGLHSKASKIAEIQSGRLATLEAIIKKMPTRYKSDAPKSLPSHTKDAETGRNIQAILEKFPAHKRILYLKARYENNELNSAEQKEVMKFAQLLLK